MESFKYEAARRLESQKAGHAAQLAKLQQTFNEAHDSVSEQVKFYERKLRDANQRNEEQRDDVVKKEGILRAALAKDEKQLRDARNYLRKEFRAAKLASGKVNAFKNALDKQEAKAWLGAVESWRSSLESMKLDEEEQPTKK